jgi:hypothetical protein
LAHRRCCRTLLPGAGRRSSRQAEAAPPQRHVPRDFSIVPGVARLKHVRSIAWEAAELAADMLSDARGGNGASSRQRRVPATSRLAVRRMRGHGVDCALGPDLGDAGVKHAQLCAGERPHSARPAFCGSRLHAHEAPGVLLDPPPLAIPAHHRCGSRMMSIAVLCFAQCCQENHHQARASPLRDRVNTCFFGVLCTVLRRKQRWAQFRDALFRK